MADGAPATGANDAVPSFAPGWQRVGGDGCDAMAVGSRQQPARLAPENNRDSRPHRLNFLVTIPVWCAGQRHRALS